MADWLGKELGNRLIRIRQSIFDSSHSLDLNECEHGQDHCNSIEHTFHHLIYEDLALDKLSEKERFFLLSSPWILNFSWNRRTSSNHSSNTGYGKSHEMLNDENVRKILGITPKEAEIFRLMIYYHDVVKDLERCPPKMADKKKNIRVRLLAAYLRLSDAIHVDNCGGPTSLFYFLENFDSPELFHWCKSKLKPTIEPRYEDRKIYVYITNQIRDLDQNETVIRRILDELEFCVNSVKNTIVAGDITLYLQTSIEFFDGPPLSERERGDLEKLIKEFALSFPPNAGTLQRLYLESIEKALSRRNVNQDTIFKEIDELQNIAQKTYEFRPFHKGLQRYISDVNRHLRRNVKEIERLDKMRTWVSNNRDELSRRLQRVYEEGTKELIAFDHMMVFGFSSTVIGTLSEMIKTRTGRDNDLQIYVCEAHNKSRFDSAGRLRYIDGTSYASALKNKLPNAKVMLIPDITLATTFKINEGEKWAVLFGANGITSKAKCLHTAGHLSVAIISKHFNIPVYILADSYKIGDLDERGNIYNERHEQWLSTVVPLRGRSQYRESLEGAHAYSFNNWFVLKNVRESIVEPELIHRIITEDGVFSTEQFSERYKK